MNRKLAIIISLFISAYCLGQRPTPQDFEKSLEKPQWEFHTKEMDSCTFNSYNIPRFYRCDSAIAFITSNGAWNYKGEPDLEHLYIISTNTGKIIWQKKNEGGNIKCYFDKDKVISLDSVIICYNIFSGKTIWSFTPEQNVIVGRIKIAGSYAYLEGTKYDKNGSESYLLYKVDLNTGKLKKTILNIPTLWFGVTTIYSHFALFMDYSKLICFDLNAGKISWTFTPDLDSNGVVKNFSLTFPFYFSKDTLYCLKEEETDSIIVGVCKTATVIAMDIKTGKKLKELYMGRKYGIADPYVDDGAIYASIFSPHHFTCFYMSKFSFKDLKTIWCDSIPITAYEPQYSFPGIDSNNIYFISDSTITTINKKTGQILHDKGTSEYIEYIMVTDNFLIAHIVSNDTLPRPQTMILDKKMPDKTALSTRNVVLMNEDIKHNELYMIDIDTKTLLKVKLPQ